MSTYGILVGGGPAPGINGVIGAAATTAARSGARVVGIHDGFKWIMEGDASHVRELDEETPSSTSTCAEARSWARRARIRPRSPSISRTA